jgi:hypothetical protein
MRSGDHHSRRPGNAGVAGMIEYVMISTIVMILLVILMLLVNANFMEGPVNSLTYSEFTDIGNGVSTRIVDIYSIAPTTGNISSRYNLPDDIVGRGYFVEIGSTTGDTSTQVVTISRDTIITNIAIAGITTTTHGRAIGNTTGAGINRISYDSKGFY